MTKILVVGDVHGNEKFFARACRVAAREGCDTLLQLGDFGYWEHFSHGRRFLAVAEYELAERGLDTFWIDGNHENHPKLWDTYNLYDENQPETEGGVEVGIGVSKGDFLTIRPHVFYIPRGTTWEWGGAKFVACGGAHSGDKAYRNPGVSWWSTETITDEQVEEAIKAGSADVVVSHDAPWGFDLPALAFKTPYPESKENRRQLSRIVEALQPNLLLHGHYHQRYGNWHALQSGKKLRIEGLGADLDGDGRAWLILNLEGQ